MDLIYLIDLICTLCPAMLSKKTGAKTGWSDITRLYCLESGGATKKSYLPAKAIKAWQGAPRSSSEAAEGDHSQVLEGCGCSWEHLAQTLAMKARNEEACLQTWADTSSCESCFYSCSCSRSRRCCCCCCCRCCGY